MKCSIVGLGTALPPEQVAQEDALAMSAEVICEDAKQERMLRMLFRKAGVSSRRTVIPWQYGYKWKKESLGIEDDASVAVTGSVDGPGTAERMQLYAEHAPPLAIAAARMALKDSGIDASEATHLVTVSCTGFEAPGVDIELIRGLPLSPTVQRVNVGFMGCHGAINGIRTVRGLVAADPSALVLMVCVELCSLHYRMTWDEEGIIGNALFADGAAAIIATADNSRQQIGEVIDTGACLIEDSSNEMSWVVGDHGFQMRLTGRVPEFISANLKKWITEWLASHDLKIDDIAGWVVHPGGPRIIDAVEESLDLENSHTQRSRDVLCELGNMSSPTVLFVLERLRAESVSGPVVMLAFGPGLMAEAALLRC